MGYPQMQIQQPMMQYGNPMAAYGGQGMTGFMGNAFIPQAMGGGTYASYAQNMSNMGYGGMGLGMEAELNPNQRAAIDRWRMDIGS
jgi:hypothetical protein